MDAHYDVEAWAGETRLGRRIFNHGIRMGGSEAPGWTLVKSVPLHGDEELRETAYIWQQDEAQDRMLVRVLIAELPGWREAQKYLRQSLDHSMRRQLPGGAGTMAVAGDVGFSARDPESDVPAAIFLVRGNVAVVVNSVGSVAVDVSGFAEAADAMLEKEPAAGWTRKGEALSRRAGPDGKAQVVPSLKDLEGGWVKLEASDGELRREGDSIVYIGPEDARIDLVWLTLDPAGPSQPAKDGGTGEWRRWLGWIVASLIALLLLVLARTMGRG